jgi:hypothetical protein
LLYSSFFLRVAFIFFCVCDLYSSFVLLFHFFSNSAPGCGDADEIDGTGAGNRCYVNKIPQGTTNCTLCMGTFNSADGTAGSCDLLECDKRTPDKYLFLVLFCSISLLLLSWLIIDLVNYLFVCFSICLLFACLLILQ